MLIKCPFFEVCDCFNADLEYGFCTNSSLVMLFSFLEICNKQPLLISKGKKIILEYLGCLCEMGSSVLHETVTGFLL